jgi:hypothetical protein
VREAEQRLVAAQAARAALDVESDPLDPHVFRTFTTVDELHHGAVWSGPDVVEIPDAIRDRFED